MASRKNLGTFEQAILMMLVTLRDNAYGVSIYDELHKLGRPSSIGAIYTTLDRLEQKGLVKSWLGEPTNERGGRAKRYYRITATGQTALNRSAHTMRRILRPALEAL